MERRMLRKTMVSLGSTVSAVLLAGVMVVSANAFSGRVQGAALEGNWYYDWTYSKAEGSATYDRVYVWAKQDGTVRSVLSKGPGGWHTIDAYGKSWNVDDGAGLQTRPK